VNLGEIAKLLDAEVLVGESCLGVSVSSAFVGDLMSDVLAYAKPGAILITGLISQQILRTADLLDITAVVMGGGKKPSPEVLRLAKELDIPLITSKFILFEIAGRLYSQGIRGCIEKVED